MSNVDRDWNTRQSTAASAEVKPCAKCGARDRHKDGKCRPCAQEYARRYREANRDKALERVRRWREANPDKARECDRRYREANRDKLHEYARRYYEANRDKELERARRRREAKRAALARHRSNTGEG